MPIYDYACTRCGRVVEVVHGVAGRGPEACETCGGPMRKLLSTPAVHFKGSGWAKKDRATSSTTKAAARSTSGGASSDGKTASSDAGSEASTSSSSTSESSDGTPTSRPDPA